MDDQLPVGEDKGGKGGDKSGEKGDSKGGKGQDDSSRDKNDDQNSGGTQTDRDGNDAQDQEKDGGRDGSGGSSPKTGVMAAVEKVAGFLKWVVFAIVAILVLIGIVLAVLRFLSPFTEWAKNLLDAIRNWWASLFGGKAGRSREEPAVPEQLGPVRPPPFHAFSNPFEDGTADGRDPAELVEYTFAALDSWAWDQGHGRRPTETPLEFAARLGDEFEVFRPNVRRLANLYARVAYSELPLPDDTPRFLEQVWDQLVHGVDVAQPVAAADERD